MKVEDNTHYVDYGSAGYTAGSVARRSISSTHGVQLKVQIDYFSTGAVCGELALLTGRSQAIKFICQTDVQVKSVFMAFPDFMSWNIDIFLNINLISIILEN